MALQVSCDYKGCDKSGSSTGGFNRVQVSNPGGTGGTESWWCNEHYAEVCDWFQGQSGSGR